MPDIFEADDLSQKTPETTGDAGPAATPAESQTSPQSHQKPIANENHIHALAMYCQNPSFFLYQGKDISGSLQFFLRRHIVTNIPWILATILLCFIPPLVQILLSLNPTNPTIPANFLVVFLLFYYLVVVMYAFLSFLNWFYNIIIVTNTEVVDIDYADIIYHDLAATNINLVEDVQYIQSGFIAGLFNFGNIYVQTAGDKENIEGIAIPRPAEIAKFILSYIGKGELGG